MPLTHSDPCVDGIYDSISCDHENKLMVTFNNLIFYGDCSSYPFHVNQNYQVLIDKNLKIIASVTDGHGFQYFFEEQNVILVSKTKRFEKPISEIFYPFSGIIEHAVSLKDKESKAKFGSDFVIQLYTKNPLSNKRRVYNYDEVKILNGLPFWSETQVLKPLNHSIAKTSYPVFHLLTVQKGYITAILGSSSDPIYSKAGLYTCIDVAYQYDLLDCLEENEEIYEVMQRGDLFRCQSRPNYPFDLLKVMLWFSFGLTILSVLGLIKCLIVKLFKKYRISNRRVRFSDEVRGDPKEVSAKYVSYGPEQIHIETAEPGSMGQYTADDVNDEFKDVNLSIDLKEDHFTYQ